MSKIQITMHKPLGQTPTHTSRAETAYTQATQTPPTCIHATHTLTHTPLTRTHTTTTHAHTPSTQTLATPTHRHKSPTTQTHTPPTAHIQIPPTAHIQIPPTTYTQTPPTTHTQTSTTTQNHTYRVYSGESQPGSSRDPTVQALTGQEQDIQTLIQQLYNENNSLRADIRKLSTRCTTLEELCTTLDTRCNTLETQLNNAQQQLTQTTAAPRGRQQYQNLVKRWHENANSITGAAHSRASPTNAFDCVHSPRGGCRWQNKKVTMQAYVLHLKRNHGENISDNPDLSLLPVLHR